MEGRNGRLSLFGHGQGPLTADRLKALTAMHNYVVRRADGSTQSLKVKSRIDTPIEVDYYKHGGILPYVLRELISKAGPAKAKAAPSAEATKAAQ